MKKEMDKRFIVGILRLSGRSDSREQHARFIETARKLECDEDEARFKEKLGKIAKAKPKSAADGLAG